MKDNVNTSLSVWTAKIHRHITQNKSHSKWMCTGHHGPTQIVTADVLVSPMYVPKRMR